MANIWRMLRVLTLLGATPAAAQQPADAPAKTNPVPPTVTLYYNAKGHRQATAEGADHREELVYRDSAGGTARVYYPSGKVRRLVPYAHFAYGLRQGSEMSFYETGELKSRCEYQLNAPLSPCLQYYRTGGVRWRMPVQEVAATAEPRGECLMPDGTPATAEFLKSEKMPAMLNGRNATPQAVVEFVQRRVKFPMEALQRQISGRVVVGFIVDDAGFVRNVHIVSSVASVYNATVLQAVGELGRFTPGEMGGVTVDVSYQIPITFSIQ